MPIIRPSRACHNRPSCQARTNCFDDCHALHGAPLSLRLIARSRKRTSVYLYPNSSGIWALRSPAFATAGNAYPRDVTFVCRA